MAEAGSQANAAGDRKSGTEEVTLAQSILIAVDSEPKNGRLCIGSQIGDVILVDIRDASIERESLVEAAAQRQRKTFAI